MFSTTIQAGDVFVHRTAGGAVGAILRSGSPTGARPTARTGR